MSEQTRPPTEDDQGYGFAFFRSHSMNRREYGSWLVPNFTHEMTVSNQSNHGHCACGQGYCVSDQYHWHDMDGKCHNRVECNDRP